MKLADLIIRCPIERTTGDLAVEIEGLTADSREVRAGYLFAAVRGTERDGHSFIAEAVERGAAAVVAEDASRLPDGMPGVVVRDCRRALGEMAAAFYGEPSRRMKLAGVTGTNGKTTTVYLIEAMVKAGGFAPGVIGTVNYRYGSCTIPAANTTPGAVDLQSLMAGMVADGVTHCIMEVSSHALDQERVAGCSFDTVIFTNLTGEHLDYHGTMEDYGRAKERLFVGKTSGYGAAVINMDDPFGRGLAARCSDVVTYGMEEGDIRPLDMREDAGGLEGVLLTPWGRLAFRSALIGAYNLYNIMAAAGAALSMGVGKEAVEEGIRSLGRVPGRIERVPLPGRFARCRVFVDYAHTPDALERVIEALRPTTEGRLITLFGCGGERDRKKRPTMGWVSVLGSDFTIVTSDNPRGESPDAIIREIVRGITDAGGREGRDYCIVPDRREAIRTAAAMMNSGDTLLIAGKGHEDYQILGDGRIHFDDREEAEHAFEEVAVGAKVA